MASNEFVIRLPELGPLGLDVLFSSMLWLAIALWVLAAVNVGTILHAYGAQDHRTPGPLYPVGKYVRRAFVLSYFAVLLIPFLSHNRSMRYPEPTPAPHHLAVDPQSLTTRIETPDHDQ